MYGNLYYFTDSPKYIVTQNASVFRHFNNIPKLDILFAVSSDLTYEKVESKSPLDSVGTRVELNLPQFTLALESEIRDWLVFRMGINKSFHFSHFITAYEKNEIDYDVEYINLSEKDIVVNFGLGFQLKGFMLDLGIEGEVFRNPIQKVVGFDDLGTNTSATITYSW